MEQSTPENYEFEKKEATQISLWRYFHENRTLT